MTNKKQHLFYVTVTQTFKDRSSITKDKVIYDSCMEWSKETLDKRAHNLNMATKKNQRHKTGQKPLPSFRSLAASR